MLSKISGSRLQVLVRTAIEDNKPEPEITSGLLHIPYLPLSLRGILIHEQADYLSPRDEIMQQAQPFCSEQCGKKCGARYVGAGPVEIWDEAFLDWVFANAEDNRNRFGCCLRRTRRLESTYCC